MPFLSRWLIILCCSFFFFFQAEDGIRDVAVTGVQTCALPICPEEPWRGPHAHPRARRRGAPRRLSRALQVRGDGARRAPVAHPWRDDPPGRRARDRKSVV